MENGRKSVHDGVQDVHDVIEWLEQVEKLDELIAAKESEYKQLMTKATHITPELSGMPHASGVSDKVGNYGIKLTMKAQEVNVVWDRYIAHRDAVIHVLEKLPAKQYGVLHRYYVLYMTWEAIAEDLDVSVMTIYRWRDKAYNTLLSVIECYTIPMV